MRFGLQLKKQEEWTINNPNEQAKKMGKIISRCWADEAFKQQFMADPATILKEAGLEVPEGAKFKVVENTDKVNYILLPAKPSELTDEQLDGVSGGLCGGKCHADCATTCAACCGRLCGLCGN
ncbi:MAG: NHLP leader peptide family RiPP precursor [Syntrophomonas sp.]